MKKLYMTNKTKAVKSNCFSQPIINYLYFIVYALVG